MLITIAVAALIYFTPDSEAINGIVAFTVLEIDGAVTKKRANGLNRSSSKNKNLSEKRKIISKNISDRKVFYETLTSL
ncbi:MAG: hypothetical protein RR128_05495, partial [Clostridium sp.]